MGDLRIERWWWRDDDNRSTLDYRHEVLWRVLQLASYSKDVDSCKSNPLLTRYVEGAGTNDIVATVAVSNKHGGKVVGVAWMQRWTDVSNRGYCFVRDDVPEVVVAVEPDFQKQGIGTLLMSDLIEGAKERVGVSGVCLSVLQEHGAVGLYERLGFQRIDAVEGQERLNWVGTTSYDEMVLWFPKTVDKAGQV